MSNEWWVMSDENWVMSDGWWKLNDEWSFFVVVNIAIVILLLYALFWFNCFVGINDMYTPSSYRVKKAQNCLFTWFCWKFSCA